MFGTTIPGTAMDRQEKRLDGCPRDEYDKHYYGIDQQYQQLNVENVVVG